MPRKGDIEEDYTSEMVVVTASVVVAGAAGWRSAAAVVGGGWSLSRKLAEMEHVGLL